ncbi:lymphocyte antigen 6B-like [Rattus rattus]|uniref:lymphocyte antigen 6B-like n=1 Tax=Rattus rattus TaxID=10117 RepID=UPI0013F2D91F|nr:lymphocyte antigen 6B-like [Rattus rattus]
MNSSSAMKSCRAHPSSCSLLCAERAQGLDCYNCMVIPFHYTCSSTATCPYPDGVCAIQVAEVVMDSIRQKVKSNLCLPICPKSTQIIGILGIVVYSKISCCNRDLCNAAVPNGGST